MLAAVTPPADSPTDSLQGFHRSASSTTLALSRLLGNSRANTWEGLSRGGLDFHFPDGHWGWNAFQEPVAHAPVLFGKIVIQVLCPTLHQVAFLWYKIVYILFLIFWMSSLYIFDIKNNFLGWTVGKYFLPFYRLPFHSVNYCFLCCAEAFEFYVVSQIYFCFCYLCFGIIPCKWPSKLPRNPSPICL